MLSKYKEDFTDERWEELCKLIKRKGMKVSSQDFTISELQIIINETPLSENQKNGAKLYYIYKLKMNQIATRLNYSDSTVKYYKKRISNALKLTCCRMFK